MIVATQESEWLSAYALPLRDRFRPAPADLLQHLARVNASSSLCVAHAVSPSADFIADLQAALDELPAVIPRLLNDTYLGIYFASGVGSSAATDIVVSPRGEFMGLMTVLDVDALGRRSANEWASWRESTPFEADSHCSVTISLAAADDDNRQHALQFLLLHEIGHALGAGRKLLPDWWFPLPDGAVSSDYRFLSISWAIDPQRQIVPTAGNDFPLRRELAYYSQGVCIASSHLPALFEALEQSSFPTLYATMSVFEDFAESFAVYVHIVMLGKPYRVHLRCGQNEQQYAVRWDDARFATKRALLKHLLGDG